MDSSTQLSLSPPRVLPRRKRTRAQWKRQIAWRTRYRDFNKYGLPVNQIPASVMDRRRAASKAARKARRAAR